VGATDRGRGGGRNSRDALANRDECHCNFRLKMDTVDVELDNLCDTLHASLAFQLIVHTNRAFWYEMDELSNENVTEIENTIDFAFEIIMDQYEHIPKVYDLLENARIMAQNITWAAMNVPFPHDTDRHLERVCDNVYRVFVETCYPAIRTAMIDSNYKVIAIQRCWKNAVSNPNFMVCRRRLEREFECLKE